jgi:inward rectifier potassium channel
MAQRPVRKRDGTDDVVVVGARPRPWHDFYHALLGGSWPWTLGVISCAFLLANLLFAALYVRSGGIANASGSFPDAFFFSVHTLATVGYGSMYPTTLQTNVIVVVETIVGLLLNALATGLIFAKFSRTRSRLVFADLATISPMDGVPTLYIRLGNERGNAIVEAQVKVGMVRTERTREGVLFYRMYDLELLRERTPALARSWSVMHRIDSKSPLFGLTPRDWETQEVELLVSVMGIDETTLQTVHGRFAYRAHEVAWGARHADILSERPDGIIELDARRFDRLTPTDPTPDFPHTWVGPPKP